MEILNINDNSGKLYYVGGVVRDEILGVKSLDTDLIYEGNAIEFAKEKNFDIIQVNEPFGTVRINLNGKLVDIASTRHEIYPKPGHLPVVSDIGCPLSEDVKRRDFTINSLYKSVKTGEIIDFTGGIDDIKNKKLRILHDKSFIEDPTRILRMLKFRMRFGFCPYDSTFNFQMEYLRNINQDVSYKRIKKEFEELFGYIGGSVLSKTEAFKILVNEGIYKLLCKFSPELSKINFNEELLKKSSSWIIWGGLLPDISYLPLTKKENKILNDLAILKNNSSLSDEFCCYKTFSKMFDETIILYAMLYNKSIALNYLNNLKNIKLLINGQDLIELGLEPSKNFNEIFDLVLKEKLKNPSLSKQDEINIMKNLLG